MSTLTLQQTKFDNTNNTDVVSSSAPSGATGITNSSGHSGFFVYSEKPYTLWIRDSLGSWNTHQIFTSENLITASTFKWGANQAAYFQTVESSHDIYVCGKSGALLVDSTPSDGSNLVDTLILDDATSLIVFGASSTTTTTESVHAISSGSPVTIADGCAASVVIKEVISGYTDSLSADLAAYYKFENNANDSSVAANHGAKIGACVYASGKSGLGTAIHQTSDSAYISLNNPDIMNLGANFTVAAWVYIPSTQTPPTTDSDGDIFIFSNSDQHGNWTYMSGFQLAVGKPGYAGGWSLPSNCLNLYSGVGQGNGVYSYAWYAVGTPQDSFPYDEWVHIAITANNVDQAAWGSNIKLFINGQSQVLDPRSNQPVQNPMSWSTNPLTTNLGAHYMPSHPKPLTPSGELKYDEIAFWKRELSESEISDLYSTNSGVELDLSYETTEAVRSDFTVEKSVTVTAPAGTDTTNIKVEITK